MDCALCYRLVPGSEIGLRGRLNFCQSCASKRSEECLARLAPPRPRRSRLKSLFMTVCALGLICGLTYWIGKSYFAKELQFLEAVTFGNHPEAVPSELSPDSKTESASGRSSWLERMFAGKEKGRDSVEYAGSLHLLYVIGAGTDARRGLSSRLFITRETPGDPSAKLITDVGREMKISFEESLRYVRKQPRDWEKEFSVRLSFEDKFSSKDGGSAATGFALGMIAAIQSIELDPEVAVTGDVTIDGTVQQVGGIVEKVRGAIEGKCKLTLIPERNSRDIVDFVLLFGTSPLWETQVFSIATIEQAMGLAKKNRRDAVRNAIERFAALRARLPATVTDNYLQSPVVQTELKEILKLAPNHLSAATLLRTAEFQLPKELSLNRSVEEIIASAYIFVSPVINPAPVDGTKSSSENKGITVFPEREFNECSKYLHRITPLLDRRSLELKASCLGYAGSMRAILTYQPPDLSGRRSPQDWHNLARRESDYVHEAKSQMDAFRSRILLALRKLETDGGMISEILKK